MKSLAVVAVSFALGIFFYGASTYLLLLGLSFLLLITLLIRARSIFAGDDFTWSKVHSVALFYVLYLVLNIFTSIFAENSVHISWILFSLPMVLMVCAELNDDRWYVLVRLLAISALFSAGWGVSEFVVQGGRATGPGVDPNAWVSMLNLFYFILVSVFVTRKGTPGLVALGLLSLVSIAIFTGYSRVGNFNFVVGVIFVGAVLCLSADYRKKAALLILSAVLSLGLVNGYRSAEQATGHNEGYTLDIASSGWDQRLAQWQSGLDQYADYPVFGSGLGTFKLLYPSYRSTGDLRTAGNYIHNDYIQFLAEGGPVLLGFALVFVVFLIYLLCLNLLRFKQSVSLSSLESIILIVAIGTVLVHALMNFTLYNLPNQILMAVCLGRLLYLNGLLINRRIIMHSPNISFAAAVVLTAYIMVVNVLDFVSFDLVYKQGLLPTDFSGELTNELPLYQTLSFISGLRQNISGNRFAMATFYRRSFDLLDPGETQGRESLAVVTALEYEQGLKLNPFHYQVREFYADFLLQNPGLMNVDGITQTPEKLLRQGLATGPCYTQRYLNLAKLLQFQGQADEAYALLVDGALPWSGLKYDGYQYFQVELFQKILHEAKIRQDRATLEQLLIAISRAT